MVFSFTGSARRKQGSASAQFSLFAFDKLVSNDPVETVSAAIDQLPTFEPPVAVAAAEQEEASRSKAEIVSDPENHHDEKIITEQMDSRPSRDFRITDAHAIGQGSLAAKARDNVAAIRALKTIEAEDRDATDDEKIILARYVGWGALSQVFGYYPPDNLRDTATAVRELLTDAEYRSAQASTPNAHYTSPMVISAIWEGLRHIGVGDGARILEPAMGVGHFFGLMPDHFAGAQRTGVELDSITARIAKKLYPDAAIFAKGFEETALPDNYMDVVVGNVPFGDYAVYDPAVKHPLRQSIHDYFFAKSLMKLRPGGVMALITSRYTMDKETDTVRRHIADSADLLGAIRLPNTAFRENAGTQVTTDILFLRKREPGQERSGQSWQELDSIFSPAAVSRIEVNEYFAAHPHMMLGELALIRGRYGNSEPTLNGELTAELLAGAIGQLPASAYIPRDQQRPPPALNVDPFALIGVKDGGYVMRDGSLFIRNGATLEATSLPQTTIARVVGQMAVRDAVREVLSTQLNDEPEHAIVRARLLLNREYDNFTRRHGPISSRENVRAFSGDPDQPLLLSLEKYDPDSRTATKAAIFTERTLQRSKVANHVDTAGEALAISLNEHGRIVWPLMQALTKRSEKKLQHELGPMVYRAPDGNWETADAYLSGNVRIKLVEAEAATALDKSFARNVEALKAVQPVDLQPGDINARLGSSWIPATDVAAFIHHILDVPASSVSVANSNALAVWSVDSQWSARASVNNTTTHGTTRATALDLIEGALNNRTPTIYDVMPDETRVVNQLETIAAREAQQKLKDNFSEWIWTDEARAQRLARDYNDRFNNIRLRTYDGSHQTFPGMNRTMLRNEDLDKHQKDAVWRIIQSDSTLIAAVVGGGKTWTIVAACMEMKRLGIVEKPLIAVPNHLVEQWGSAFLQLYPQANILLAGKDTFTTGNRQKIMARIATGRYDAVIVAHSSFEKIPVLDDTFEDFIQGQIDQLEDAKYETRAQTGDTRPIVKELEKAKKRLVARLKERADRENKDDGVTFEQLGVDCLFVDEVDLFKNLAVTTKMTRVAGLPNTESNRAADMYIKAEYLRNKGGKRGYATGTPISNSMVEMYTWQRHLDPGGMQSAGVAHFDAWAANFGEAVTSLELAPDGSGYRMHTRFSKFVNLPELLSMFRSFADVQTAEMLNLPRPALDGGKPKIAVAPSTPELKEFVASLVERAKDLKQKHIDPSIDNMLKITGDGRKAALDMRLVDPYAEPSDTKVERAIERIHAIWMETHANRSTQLVFCDLSTPKPDRFNIYHEVRDRLLERGVPDREVAFIHDADTDAKKKALFDSVNAGRVRILLGSTEKMGAGTNVQKRLKALHHLDAPWRPRDIEQREGRILRQGNDNETVDIYRYVTEGSFDAYMWQTLETKARFIGQVMSGSVTVREAEDLESGALTYAEIKAIASGNPAVMEKVRVDTEIRKLDQLRASHINQQHKIRWELRNIPEQLENSAKYLAACREDIATRDSYDDQDFCMTVGKITYTGKDARMRAGEALNEVASSWRNDQSMQARAHYRGFDILTRAGLMRDAEPDLFIRRRATYRANLNLDSATGTMSSIDHALRKLDQHAEREQQEIARQEKALADYKTQLGRPFDHADRLKELVAKQAELNALLDLDKSDAQAVADTPTAPAEVAQPAPAPFDRGPPPVTLANGLAGVLARPSTAQVLEPAP